MSRLVFLFVLVAALAACAPADGADDTVAVPIGSAQSAVRILDLDAVQRVTATVVPATSPDPLPTVTMPPAPTATVLASPTAVPAAILATASPAVTCRDRAEFVQHVSMSPGTALLTGQWFTKIWRVRNVGDCIWSSEYTLRFLSGEMFSGPASFPLPQPVAPGETIDLSLNLIAPPTPGEFSGEWVLTDSLGETVPMQSLEAPSPPTLPVQIVVRAAKEPKLEMPEVDDCR